MRPAIAVPQSFTFKPTTSSDPFWERASAVLISRDREESDRLFREAREYARDLSRKIGDIDRQRAGHAARADCLQKIGDWMGRRPSTLEHPAGSRLPALMAAWEERRTEAMDRNADYGPFFATESQAFLVEHDWAKAFEGATDYSEGEYPLPFEHCCFEFHVSGLRTLLMLRETDEGQRCVIAYDAGDYWALGPIGDLTVKPVNEPPHKEMYAYNCLIHDTVRAISIALDAGAAVADVVRSSYAAIRPATGTARMGNSYHVVRLTRQARPAPLGEHAEGRRVRLHFRRGHWRHFATHKTWIKWMMVGDPDLGFIDKHYRA